MKFSYLCICVFAILGKLQESSALRNVKLHAPEVVVRGQSLRMRCVYDLEGLELYSVRWYFGHVELCRYSPRDVPPLKVFKVPHMEVVREETDGTRLTLARVTRHASGQYVCEVIAEHEDVKVFSGATSLMNESSLFYETRMPTMAMMVEDDNDENKRYKFQ